MKKLKLDGNWNVCQIDNPSEGKEISAGLLNKSLIPATVPGDIHKDLLNAGQIIDPYVGDNLKLCRWVTEKHWCFIKTFELPENFSDTHNHICLKGIDTFSEIYLNGRFIGETKSMFKGYSFPVDGIIRSNGNILCVVIKSIQQEMKKFPSEGYNACFNHERIFIRKSQCHFSWDWAPQVFGTGIFDSVYLKSNHGASIENILVRTKNNGDIKFLFKQNTKHYNPDTVKKIKLLIFGPDFSETYFIENPEEKKLFLCRIENPQLWFPAGYGEQNLYTYSVTLFEDGNAVDSKTGTFAFREISVDDSIREDMSAARMVFKINGTPVFLKGANWVNIDIFTGTVSDSKYEKLLDTLIEGNMNCLRVWGGGFYEKDIFYKLCDEKGILIWQDFMFACAEIPDDFDGFYSGLREEAAFQVKRLRNHPSIIAWCGGNEKPGGFEKIKCNGIELFKYLFRGVAGHYDPTRPYFDSSPSGYEEPSNLFTSGDSHASGYIESVYLEDAEKCHELLSKITGSLMTEVAIMGSSPIESVKKYIPEEHLWPTDEVWDIHVRDNPYDMTNDTFLDQQKRMAKQHFGEITGLYDFVKKSAVTQAEHVKMNIEFHRSRAFDCSGALLWMYSDIWPCGSWSIVDYYLTKKAAFYAAKRACKSVLPIITYHSDGLKAFVANDTGNIVKGDVTINHITPRGDVLKTKVINDFSAEKYGSSLVSCLNEFDAGNINGIFTISFNNEINSFVFTNYKNLKLENPQIVVESLIVMKLDGTYKTSAILKSDLYAASVYLSSKKDIDFHDNYFDLLPSIPYTVEFSSREQIGISDLIIKTRLDEWEK